MTSAPKWRRRTALVAGAVGLYAWVRYLPQLPTLFGPDLSFSPIPGLKPFRELGSEGQTSTQSAIFAGIDASKDAAWKSQLPSLRTDLCAALFPGPVEGAVPVALFSDYDCPNCRLLEQRLADYTAAHPGAIHIFRHQLPLLGPASVLTARAVLAAKLQGKEEALDRRLKRARVVASPEVLAAFAAQAGLDPERLLEDMQGAEVQAMLDRDRALAELFGFFATPGTVVGRTAFLGALPAATIAKIIAAEAALPPVSCKTA